MDRFSSLRLWLRLVLFAYVVAQCCPVEFLAVKTDIDSSWQLGLNLAAEQGLRFGQDVVWPSGPYAYLDSPMPVGDNLEQALWAQLAIWLFAALAIGDLFFVQRLPLRGLAVFAASVAIGAPMFHFNSQGMDSLLAFAALLLSASGLTCERWRSRLVPAAVAAGVAITLKLSAAVLAGSGVLATALILLFRDRRQGMEALAIAVVLGPLSGMLAYWTHNPSWEGWLSYVASMRELAAGYPAAMALEGPVSELQAALVAALAFLALAYFVHHGAQRTAGVGLLFILPLLISFKHGFIRQDIHIASYFCMVALAAGTTAAFAQRKRVALPVVVLLIMPILLIGIRMSLEARIAWIGPVSPLAIFVRTLSGATSLAPITRALDFEETHASLVKEGKAHHLKAGLMLPAALRERIGDQPVAVLSPYFGFTLLDGLNLRLLPIVQKYSAYTPDLDDRLAQWVAADAPNILLFEWISIDERHPLLEAPLAWTETRRWFDCIQVEEGWALLQRRSEPRFGKVVKSPQPTQTTRGTIRIPQGVNVVSMARSLTNAGRWKQALLRIAPVTLRTVRADGSESSFRVLPAVLASPTLLASLPLDLEEFSNMMAPTAVFDTCPRVQSVTFGGAGDSSYHLEVQTAHYRLAENLKSNRNSALKEPRRRGLQAGP